MATANDPLFYSRQWAQRRQAAMTIHAPLWTIDDGEDGDEVTACAVCGEPFVGSGWICAACVEANNEALRAKVWLETQEQDGE